MKFSHQLIAFLLFVASPLFSQVINDDSDFPEETIDRLIDLSEEQSSNSEVLEQFNLLRRQKVNINTADFSRLLSVPFLTAGDVKEILAYRKKIGIITRIDALQNILNLETYNVVRGFLTVGNPRDFRNPYEPAFISDYNNGFLKEALSIEFLARSSFETPRRQGVINGRYQGSSMKYYNRIQGFLSDNFAFSALTEKDIGEPSIADFYSISFQAREIYNLKTLVVGDYNLSFGQGLAINGGRAFFKSAEAVNAVRVSRQSVRLYTSTVEQNFFRGLASEIKIGDFTTTLFFSKNRLSTAATDSNFTSIDFSGLHRTATELQRKNNVAQSTIGGHLSYGIGTAKTYIKVGSTFFKSDFSLPFQPSSTLANTFRFNGKTINVASADWDATIYNFTLFGEVAYSIEQKSRSVLLGLEASLDKNLKTVLIARQYAKEFYSPFANAFSERGSSARNEEGVYVGFQMRISNQLQLRGYADFYRLPFINANTVLPWSGDDFVFQLSFRPSKDFLIEPLIQKKYSEDALTQTDDVGREYRMAVPISLIRYRTDFTYWVSEQLRLKSRVEFKEVRKRFIAGVESFNGWMIYQEASFDLIQKKLSIDARVAVFQVDSFDAALYAYEYDLPLIATTYAHFGNGRRILFNLRYRPIKEVEIACRFANLYRDGVLSVGSGNDQFNTNSPSVFGLGIRTRF